MSNRSRSRNAWESQLSNIVTSGATSFDVDDATGLVAPVYLVIAPTDATKREYIKVGAINTNTLGSITRDLDGSATGGPFEHAAGTKVRAVPAHQHLDDIFDDVEALETADADHAALANAHHAKVHAHDGADGSGTVAHANTTGQTADDHHAEDHALRHGAGGADAFEVDESVEVSSAAIQLLSDTTMATVTLDIPEGWNSWKCVAWATFAVAKTASTAESFLVWIRIDGVDQNAASAGVAPDDDSTGVRDAGAVGGRRTGMTTTGSRDISLMALETEAGNDFTLQDIFLYARAVRTS